MMQVKKFCAKCDRHTLNIPGKEKQCSACGVEYGPQPANGHSIKYYIEKYRNEKGIKNFIPLIPRDKKPALGKGEYAQYFYKVYEGPFEDNQNLGIMTGPTNGNLICIDDDTNGYAGKMLEDTCPKTWTNKSGKKGTHRFYRIIDGLPDARKLVKEGRNIEIFTGERLIVVPPSIHPDTGQHYQTIDDVPIENITLQEFDQMLKLLELEGWTVQKNQEREKAIKKIARGEITQVGQDRHFDILSFISTETLLHSRHNMPMGFYETIGKWAHVNYAAEQYDESEVLRLVHDAYDWAHDVPDHDKEKEYTRLKEEGPKDDKEIFSFIELLVTYKKIIEKSQIRKRLSLWLKEHDKQQTELAVNQLIDNAWQNRRIWPEVKRMALEHGRHAQSLVFDTTQANEAACWLMGRYCIKRVELTGELIYFNGIHYERDAEEFIRRQARDLFTKSTSNLMNEVFKYIEDQAKIIKSADLEKHAHLKALNNGTYDIKKGEFTPKWDADNIILNLIPHNYNDSATWETIKEKLTQILPNDTDRQTYLDFLSICLIPYTGIDFQFIGQGIPGTGKSQLTKLADMVFGPDNVSWAAIHVLAADKTIQIDNAFKMLNIDEDLSDADLKHIDTMKKWITQEKFTARSIYAHSTTFRPSARLMSMANGLYEIANEDDARAIYDRTQIVKFEKRFRGEANEIKNVFEKIAIEEELEGFLTYLLQNAHTICKNQKIAKPQTQKEIESIWNQYGNRIRQFTEKWLVHEADAKTPAYSIWDKFQEYAWQNGIKVKTKNQFYDKLDEIKRTERVKIRLGDDLAWGYVGFRLYTDEEMKKIEESPLNGDKK